MSATADEMADLIRPYLGALGDEEALDQLFAALAKTSKPASAPTMMISSG